MTDPNAFRAQFPVLASCAYLNAGTEGPMPEGAAIALRGRIDRDLEHGRIGKPYFDEVMALGDGVRSGYAAVLGADPSEVALTGSTTDGMNTVIGGLQLGSGDEILTSDEEHPGLLAPLRLARDRRGVSIRVVPFDELGGEAGPQTKLIACSHVSWVGGKVADVAALRSTGVPFVLDAAQALGAIPVDVHDIGCDFYAASGQKWLCGPEGSGCLYVRPERLDDLVPPWPGYSTLADSHEPLDSPYAETTKRLDIGFSGLRYTWALAALQVLGAAGWPWIHDHAASLATGLARDLAARGLSVAPRGRSTLVSWRVEDPDAEVERLAGHGIRVRSIPSGNLLRASVGAWSSEEELDRLVALAVP